MIERDIRLAGETGAEIDIQHISTKEGVALVREARKSHPNIHAEATPHHFSLTEEAVIKYGTLAKMNPPLRTEEDRQARFRNRAAPGDYQSGKTGVYDPDAGFGKDGRRPGRGL